MQLWAKMAKKSDTRLAGSATLEISNELVCKKIMDGDRLTQNNGWGQTNTK